MNYGDWYTDRMDISRVAPVSDGALSKHQRLPVAADVPCRVYRPQVDGPKMQPTAAKAESEEKLACANEVDVLAGDELLIRRGAGLGQVRQTIRAFAGEPVYYYEPFGAALPGLAHQEIGLLQKEYLKGAVEDGAG